MPSFSNRLAFAVAIVSLVGLLSVSSAVAQAVPPAPGEAIDDDKSKQSVNQLLVLSGAMRTHFLRHDVYPSTLKELADKGIIDKVENDPWGNELRLKISQVDATSSDDGRGRAIVRIVGGAVVEERAGPDRTKRWDFEITSSGPDGRFGTPDDITKTRTALRLNVSPEARKRIQEQGGQNYQVSVAAWSGEQAFRLWLKIAEHEYRTGETIASLEELELPKAVFPTGEPIDVFGRYLELRSVRGLRSIYADDVPEVAPSLMLTEAEFVSSLTDRMSSSGGNEWRVTQVMGEVRTFQVSRGRLPLTMHEITSAANNQWFNRARFGNSFHYITFNEDRSFVLMDLGRDAMPGGRGDNSDRIYYGPEDATTSSTDSRGRWQGDGSAAIFQELREAIRVAVEREGSQSKSDGKQESKPTPSEGSEKSVAPEPPAPVEGNASGSTNTLVTTIAGWLLAQDAGDPEPVEAAEADAEPEPYKLKSRLDLIPRLVFDAAEAQALNIVQPDDWSLSRAQHRLQSLGHRLISYSRSIGDATPPCGNIDLSNGDHFRSANNQDWRSNSWWDDDYTEPSWVVARFEPGEFGIMKALVVLAVPPDANTPIMLFTLEDGSLAGPFYARLSDQPKGWGELAAKCNGDPAVEAPAPASAPDSTEPTEPTESNGQGEDAAPVRDAAPVAPAPAGR